MLLLTILIGLGYRIWLLSFYPVTHGLLTDESRVAESASSLVLHRGDWPLYVQVTGAVALYQPLAAAFAAFGASILTLRIESMAVGLLLVPAAYLLMRQFAGAPSSLVASALLSLAYWPAMMSLLDFGWIDGLVFQSLALTLLLFALRRQHAAAAALSGGLAALCFYAYLGHRLLVVPVICLATWHFLFGAEQRALRWRVFLAFALGFATVLAPWLATIGGQPSLMYGDSTGLTADFTTQLHHDPAGALSGLLKSAALLARSLLVSPQSHEWPMFAPPFGGVLDPVLAVLAIISIAGLLTLRPRLHAGVLALCILIPFAAASTVVPVFLNSYRLSGVIPAAFVLIAVTVERMWRLGSARCPSGVTAALLAAMLVTSGLLNVHTAADRLSSCSSVAGTPGFLRNEGIQGALLATWVNRMGPGETVYVVQAAVSTFIDPVADWQWLYRMPLPVSFVAGPPGSSPASWEPAVSWLLPRKGQRFWPPRAAGSGPYVTYIAIDPGTQWFIPWLRQRYPGGRASTMQTAVCPTITMTAYTL